MEIKHVKKVVLIIDELGDSAYEMANVSKDDTGLPYNIWIDSLGKDRQKR